MCKGERRGEEEKIKGTKYKQLVNQDKMHMENNFGYYFYNFSCHFENNEVNNANHLLTRT